MGSFLCLCYPVQVLSLQWAASSVQEVLRTLFKIHDVRLILIENRPKDLFIKGRRYKYSSICSASKSRLVTIGLEVNIEENGNGL